MTVIITPLNSGLDTVTVDGEFLCHASPVNAKRIAQNLRIADLVYRCGMEPDLGKDLIRYVDVNFLPGKGK